MQIDPNRDIDARPGGSFGAAPVWIKNLTDNTAPILAAFDNLSTSGIEALLELPVAFNSSVTPPARA